MQTSWPAIATSPILTHSSEAYRVVILYSRSVQGGRLCQEALLGQRTDASFLHLNIPGDFGDRQNQWERRQHGDSTDQEDHPQPRLHGVAYRLNRLEEEGGPLIPESEEGALKLRHRRKLAHQGSQRDWRDGPQAINGRRRYLTRPYAVL
jgi:hypothetical protein